MEARRTGWKFLPFGFSLLSHFTNAAFVLPLLHRLRAHSIVAGARGVVLSPTRELALQTLVRRHFGDYGANLMLLRGD